MLKEELSEQDLALLDKAAELSQAGNEGFAALQALYEGEFQVTPHHEL